MLQKQVYLMNRTQTSCIQEERSVDVCTSSMQASERGPCFLSRNRVQAKEYSKIDYTRSS